MECRFLLDTKLGTQLADYKRRTSAPDLVLLRMVFPKTFPVHPPVLRLVQPRMKFGGRTAPKAEQMFLTDGGMLRLAQLSAAAWQPDQDIADVLLHVHQHFLSAEVDMSTRPYAEVPSAVDFGTTLCIPTVAQCTNKFPAATLELAAEILPELVDVPPGCAVLPHSCAMDIYSRVFSSSGGQRPLAVHVEIKNCTTEGRVFAGMAEVSAMQDSAVFLPAWIMRQLFLDEGDEVRIRMVSLPQCSCVHLQPLSQDFYELAGDDPLFVLHEALAPLPALTTGFSIPVELGSRKAMVLAVRLEDEAGDVAAARLPGSGGILGEHELRVELLPAVDLAESGSEYQDRVSHEALRQAKLQHVLEAKRAMQRNAATGGDIEERAGDGTAGCELCIKFPNGKQLRRRFLPGLSIADLKMFLFRHGTGPESVWKPAALQATSLQLACMFPRRNFHDDETVLAVGDRAVLHVTDMEPDSDDHQDSVAVLCPSELERAIAAVHADEPASGFRDLLEQAGEEAAAPARQHPPYPDQSEGLDMLSQSQLLQLALSLGLEAPGSLSESELRRRITRQDAVARAAAKAGSRGRGRGVRGRVGRAPTTSMAANPADPAALPIPNRLGDRSDRNNRMQGARPRATNASRAPLPRPPASQRSASTPRPAVNARNRVPGHTNQTTQVATRSQSERRQLSNEVRRQPLGSPHQRSGSSRESLRCIGQILVNDVRQSPSPTARSASPMKN